MQEPAGLVIPETSPGMYHCGTSCPGWLNGTHPVTPGHTINNINFCFDCYVSTDNDCYESTRGKVTNCGDFYVYYLEDTNNCDRRYCAADHF